MAEKKEETFYCNKCKKQVILEKGYCPTCGTNWGKIIDSTNSVDETNSIYFQEEVKKNGNNSTNNDKVTLSITENDINRNINFFLKWGAVVLVLAIIGGFVAFVVIVNEAREPEAILPALLALVGSIVSGIITYNILKWFAYMLYTNKRK